MYILAITHPDTPYFFKSSSAHEVSKRSASVICRIVNENKEKLGTKADEVWHIYEIDKYDSAYYHAQFQKFTIRKGLVKAVYR